jgi:hypothetical protein
VSDGPGGPSGSSQWGPGHHLHPTASESKTSDADVQERESKDDDPAPGHPGHPAVGGAARVPPAALSEVAVHVLPLSSGVFAQGRALQRSVESAIAPLLVAEAEVGTAAAGDAPAAAARPVLTGCTSLLFEAMAHLLCLVDGHLHGPSSLSLPAPTSAWWPTAGAVLTGVDPTFACNVLEALVLGVVRPAHADVGSGLPGSAATAVPGGGGDRAQSALAHLVFNSRMLSLLLRALAACSSFSLAPNGGRGAGASGGTTGAGTAGTAASTSAPEPSGRVVALSLVRMATLLLRHLHLFPPGDVPPFPALVTLQTSFEGFLGAEGRAALSSVFASQMVQQLVTLFVALRLAVQAHGGPFAADPRLAVADVCDVGGGVAPPPAPSPFSILSSALSVVGPAPGNSTSSVASRIAQQYSSLFFASGGSGSGGVGPGAGSGGASGAASTHLPLLLRSMPRHSQVSYSPFAALRLGGSSGGAGGLAALGSSAVGGGSAGASAAPSAIAGDATSVAGDGSGRSSGGGAGDQRPSLGSVSALIDRLDAGRASALASEVRAAVVLCVCGVFRTLSLSLSLFPSPSPPPLREGRAAALAAARTSVAACECGWQATSYATVAGTAAARRSGLDATSDLDVLQSMGFPRAAGLQALSMAGSLELAVQWLVARQRTAVGSQGGPRAPSPETSDLSSGSDSEGLPDYVDLRLRRHPPSAEPAQASGGVPSNSGVGGGRAGAATSGAGVGGDGSGPAVARAVAAAGAPGTAPAVASWPLGSYAPHVPATGHSVGVSTVAGLIAGGVAPGAAASAFASGGAATPMAAPAGSGTGTVKVVGVVSALVAFVDGRRDGTWTDTMDRAVVHFLNSKFEAEPVSAQFRHSDIVGLHATVPSLASLTVAAVCDRVQVRPACCWSPAAVPCPRLSRPPPPPPLPPPSSGARWCVGGCGVSDGGAAAADARATARGTALCVHAHVAWDRSSLRLTSTWLPCCRSWT